MSRSRLCIDARAAEVPLQVCAGFWSRLRGFGLGAPVIGGVWLEPCAAVHTLWPWRPIDIAFIAGDGRTLRVCRALRPGRVRWCVGAQAVLELPAGGCAVLGIVPGACVSVRPDD